MAAAARKIQNKENTYSMTLAKSEDADNDRTISGEDGLDESTYFGRAAPVLDSKTEIKKQQADPKKKDGNKSSGQSRATDNDSPGGFSFDGLLLPGAKIDGWSGEVGQCISHTSGEAEVYVATLKNKNYALKYYRSGIIPKQEILQLLASLDHPGLIKIQKLGQHWGRFYEIMTYCPGGPLSKKDETGKLSYLPIKENAFEKIVERLSSTLDYMHSKGIVHRDIKPGNLLVTDISKGDLQISDFGISSILDIAAGDTERMTSVNRTEGYAAPEVYSGLTRKEVDFYALGITFFVLLTAKDPFQKMNPRQVMCTTVQGKVVDHVFSLPEASKISARNKSLITGLLATQNEKRWGHDEIMRWLKGEEIGVAEVTDISLPTFKAGQLSIVSLNEMADALVQNKTSDVWQKFLSGGDIAAWVSQFDRGLGNEIKEIGLKFRGVGHLELGLLRLAFTLDQEIPFVSPRGMSATNRAELADIVEKEGQKILSSLRDPYSPIQLWMESRQELKDVAFWLRDWLKSNNKDETELLTGAVLSIRGLDIFKIDDGVFISGFDQLQDISLKESTKKKIELWLAQPKSPLSLWLDLSEASQAKRDKEFLAFFREAYPGQGFQTFLDTLAKHKAIQHGDWRYGGEAVPTEGGRLMPQGYGLAINTDGTRYLGQWHNGLMQGKAIKRNANNTVYEGNFQNGSETGMGILTKDKVWKFRGNFQNGMQNGSGQLEFSNGDYFEGTWFQGKMVGTGRYINQKVGVSYLGNWEANLRHGLGIQTYKNGSWDKGHFRENKLFAGERIKVKPGKAFYEHERILQGKSASLIKISLKTQKEVLWSTLPKALLMAGFAASATLGLIMGFRWLQIVPLVFFLSLLFVWCLPTLLKELTKFTKLFFGSLHDDYGNVIQDWSENKRPFRN